jgi:hypothetical protein
MSGPASSSALSEALRTFCQTCHQVDCWIGLPFSNPARAARTHRGSAPPPRTGASWRRTCSHRRPRIACPAAVRSPCTFRASRRPARDCPPTAGPGVIGSLRRGPSFGQVDLGQRVCLEPFLADRVRQVQQEVQQQGRTTAGMHDHRQHRQAAEVGSTSCAPVVRIERVRPESRGRVTNRVTIAADSNGRQRTSAYHVQQLRAKIRKHRR